MMEDGGWRDFMIGWGLGEYVAKFEGKYWTFVSFCEVQLAGCTFGHYKSSSRLPDTATAGNSDSHTCMDTYTSCTYYIIIIGLLNSFEIFSTHASWPSKFSNTAFELGSRQNNYYGFDCFIDTILMILTFLSLQTWHWQTHYGTLRNLFYLPYGSLLDDL